MWSSTEFYFQLVFVLLVFYFLMKLIIYLCLLFSFSDVLSFFLIKFKAKQVQIWD